MPLKKKDKTIPHPKAPTHNALIVFMAISVCLFAINYFFYNFPGNNYYPIYSPILVIFFGLLYAGFHHALSPSHRTTYIFKELFYYSMVVFAVSTNVNAIQFTPFYPIDDWIIRVENALHIPFESLLAWTYHHPKAHEFFSFFYNSLIYQVIFIPLLVILFSKDEHHISVFYFLVITSSIIGSTFYYFFPTTAPATNLKLPYFLEIQHATGIKFFQIHQWIPPTTGEGGMIAMPSFHVIWGWLILYLLKPWPLFFYALLPVNILLFMSCVLLGWHYPLDLVGSLIVILVSHRLCRFVHKHHLLPNI